MLTVNGTNTLDDCGLRGFDLSINGGDGTGIANISNVTITNPAIRGAFFRRIAVGNINNITVTTAVPVADQGIQFRDVTGSTTISNLTISGPFEYGIRTRNGDGIVYNGINSISGATIAGLHIANTSPGDIFSGFTISSNPIGILFDNNGNNNNDFNDFIIENNTDDGVQFTAASNNNEFFNTIIRNNGGDGVDIQSGNNNSFVAGTEIYGNAGVGVRISGAPSDTIIRDSEIYSNTGSGLDISSTGTGNIIEGNLFLENGSPGVNLTSGTTTFFENCLRNTTNISDVTGTTTYVSAGMGNFWGGINGTLGLEFSETCMDAGSTTTVQTDDDICDSPFVDGGTTDTAPLQICDAFFTTHNMILSKTALTFNDPVNGLQSGGNNPKAIPGATVLYTITATNQATDNRIGAASDVTITDDFTSQITGGVFSWNSNMVISSPDAGTNVPLLDPEDGDAGEFLSNLITAQCGDLNVGESCTLTFSLDIQ